MNPLIEQLRKYGSLDPEAERAIASKTMHYKRKKLDYFLKEGQYSSSYFVLSKGLIRAYIVRNNKEVNSWFGGEDQIFCSIIPVYTDRASYEYIQFLEDSEVYAIARTDLNDLYIKYPKLNVIGRKMAEEVCVVLEERINSLHTESAIERYQAVVAQYPHLLQRINLGHIASYLGITPETLSRIRKL
ncbi:Crp/Fnr family transcriptional regulator [Flavobacterium sp. JP2137]|uniref:Crp/Fnr family transcriptional regulator n=1 Tax=Flavobacterium sp. JP2137 TaxID=3414510 RepID=UPI003D2FC719